jgi:hypothetical protein
MDMPDSHPSSPEPTSWRLGKQLPVSYRVAIAVDAFVLLITICSLVLLGVYIRRQYTKRMMGLLHGHDAEYGFDDSSSEDEGDLKEEEAGRGVKDRGVKIGERKKKGHVRWTSSVVGMGVFVEWDVSEVEGKAGVKKGTRKGERGWVYDPKDAREGGPYKVEGDERQTKVNMRVAAGYDGFRGN